MNLFRIILKPKSAITTLPSSDTLFGAICWGVATLYGEKDLEQILKGYDNGKPKFITSSSFPALKIGDRFSFSYPNPILPDISSSELKEIAIAMPEPLPRFASTQSGIKVVAIEYKKFKKANYLSESLLMRLANGERKLKLFQEYLKGTIRLLNGDTLINTQDFAILETHKLVGKKVSAHNKIDRLSFSTEPGGELYYGSELHFKSDIYQLYFYLLTEDIEFLKPVFRWLSDTGIGGDRTVGRGHYEISLMDEVSTPINLTNSFISLSRYLPANDEIDWDSPNNYYKLLPCQSRLDSMFFKGTEFIKGEVIYLQEGSVLSVKSKKPYYGKLQPVAHIREKTIYQCGLTIPLFINLSGEICS